MGQYYFLVNMDKKEYVNPWKIEGLAKVWEWAANISQAGPIVLLLGWSNKGGGGDPDWDHPDVKDIAGRWAGDRVALVGDYYTPDSKGLPSWGEIKESYTEISEALIKAWNQFIVVKEWLIEKKEVRPCGTRQP